MVLPLTREWIEISVASATSRALSTVLPLTREWIEINSVNSKTLVVFAVLPLTREWIEISPSVIEKYSVKGSPSYEGVD